MIETDRLLLDKAKFSDWKAMYDNVWSQPICAKYMNWSITTSAEDAQIRIKKTIEFQQNHDTYLVYEKASGIAIGFAGVEEAAPYTYREMGICLGANYMGKGLGKEIVQGLIWYCKKEFGAKEFIYFTREENEVSNKLARSLGFVMIASEPKMDSRDGHVYQLLQYRLHLDLFDG